MDAGAYIACENEQCVVHQSLPFQRRGDIAERLVQHRHHACNIKAMRGNGYIGGAPLFDTPLMKSMKQ